MGLPLQKTDRPKPPRRRFCLAASLQADSHLELFLALRRISSEIFGGLDEGRGGIPGADYHYELTESPMMTPERFLQEVKDFAEAVESFDALPPVTSK